MIYSRTFSLKNRCCICCFCCFYSEKANAGRRDAKLNTLNRLTLHVVFDDDAGYVFGKIMLTFNPQNKG